MEGSHQCRKEKFYMEDVPNEIKLESIKSFQSSISKTEKALAQMTGKGANTTLIKKRLKALKIGLAMLENVWHERPHQYKGKNLMKPVQCLLVYSHQLKKFMPNQRWEARKGRFWKEELKHWHYLFKQLTIFSHK